MGNGHQPTNNDTLPTEINRGTIIEIRSVIEYSVQMRFKWWNEKEQEFLNKVHTQGVGFCVMDWSSLFTNVPQFDPPDRILPPVGAFEVWSHKFHRQYDRHQKTRYIRVGRRRQPDGKKPREWVDECPDGKVETKTHWRHEIHP